MSVTKLLPSEEQQVVCASPPVEGDQGGAVSTPLESLESEIDNFPPLVRDYVRLLMFETNAPMISALINTLSVISSVVQKRLFIPEVDVAQNVEGYFQTLYPNLWIMMVNRSGRHKTTALMKAHKISYEVDDIFGCDKNSQNAILEGLLEENQEDTEEIDIPKSVIVPEKITLQALILRLSEGKGGLILSSEFGSVLKVLAGADGSNTMRATLADFYDCRKGYKYETKTSGTYIIDEPFLSICGTLTYRSFDKLVTEDDVLSGFLPRFLLFALEESDDIPPALPKIDINCPYKDARENLEKHLLGLRKKIKYEISKEGKEVYTDIHNSMYNLIKYKDMNFIECLDPFMRRWSPYVLKIAMLIEYCKDSCSTKISKDSIWQAFKVVDVAYTSTLKLLDEYIIISEKEKLAQKVILRMKRHGNKLTRKELLESKIMKGCEEYDSTMKYMEIANKIKITYKNKKPVLYEII